MKFKKAFTLIELMIVVAILGTLASIGVPKFADMIKKAKEASTKGALGGFRAAISIYYVTMEEQYPRQLSALFPDFIDGSGFASAPDDIPIAERIDWADGELPGGKVTDGWCDSNAVTPENDGPWGGPFPPGDIVAVDGVLCKYRPCQEWADQRSGWNYCPVHGEVWVDELGTDTKGVEFRSW